MTRKLIGIALLSTACCLCADGPSLASGQSSPARILAWRIAVKGTEEVELRSPVAAAAASDQEFAVADTQGPRLLVFQRSGLSWQLSHSTELPAVPVDLTHDGDRYFASLRQSGGLIALEGEELSVRRFELPAGVFPGPISAAPSRDLLVYDYAGERVLRLSSTGEVTDRFPVAGRVAALAATPNGGFFAAQAMEQTVSRYSPTGQLEFSFEVPAGVDRPTWLVGLSVEPNGQILAVDRNNGRILVFSAAGDWIGIGSRRGWEPGLMYYPASIYRLSDRMVVVADQGYGRAQIFERTDGAPGRCPVAWGGGGTGSWCRCSSWHQ